MGARQEFFLPKFFAVVKARDGIVMPIALMVVLLLTAIALGALVSSSIDILTTRNQRQGKGAFYAADGGLSYGRKELESLLATTLDPTSAQLAAITAPTISGYTFDTFSVAKDGGSTTKTLTTGPYASLNAITQAYLISSQASGTATDSGTVSLTQKVEDQLIPLFQFGVFYDNDLEIFPGPTMTFNGRIHSNQNIHIGSSSALNVDSRMSSAGDIYSCRKDTATTTCYNTRIKKKDGTYATLMPSGATSPNSNDHCQTFTAGVCATKDNNWATSAYNTWGGLVQDSAHGVKELNLPLGTSDPLDLIKRGDTINPASSSESQSLKDSRMYWKADLRILDGAAYDRNGNAVTLDPNVISTKYLYDYREGKVITLREVDVGLLNSCTCKPANGILYVSETQDPKLNNKAVRLANGTTVPAGGLTVASDNPVYVKGDYNTNVKKGAAIMGDAVTFLSNRWQDTDAKGTTGYVSSTALSSRLADGDSKAAGQQPTTVNAAVVTGNTNTTPGTQYNGGLENLPRFLENWSGVNFNYSGSLINLWNSQQHKAPWPSTGKVYNPPNRNWSYDTAFDNPANLPPGTPRVRNVARTQWARK